jgi:hypothetical protein
MFIDNNETLITLECAPQIPINLSYLSPEIGQRVW